MALLNTTKLVYGALGVGVVGGGSGAGAYYYLSNSDSKDIVQSKSVKEKLQEVGYLVLTNQGEEWGAVLKEYNQAEQEKIFPDSTAKAETEGGLKDKCTSAINSKDDANYKLAKKWCVKIETIEEMLKRNNYTKLGESTVSDNQTKWEAKVNAIKAILKNQRNIDLTFKDDGKDVSVLEAKCKQLNVKEAKTFSHDDFESNYTQVRDWCATKN